MAHRMRAFFFSFSLSEDYVHHDSSKGGDLAEIGEIRQKKRSKFIRSITAASTLLLCP